MRMRQVRDVPAHFPTVVKHLVHAQVHGGAGAAVPRGAAAHWLAAFPGALVGERLRAVRAAHPQPRLRTLPIADHKSHLLPRGTPPSPPPGPRWPRRGGPTGAPPPFGGTHPQCARARCAPLTPPGPPTGGGWRHV